MFNFYALFALSVWHTCITGRKYFPILCLLNYQAYFSKFGWECVIPVVSVKTGKGM